jgi:hypothetical protein
VTQAMAFAPDPAFGISCKPDLLLLITAQLPTARRRHMEQSLVISHLISAATVDPVVLLPHLFPPPTGTHQDQVLHWVVMSLCVFLSHFEAQFTPNNSVIFSVFTDLGGHHHNVILEYFVFSPSPCLILFYEL